MKAISIVSLALLLGARLMAEDGAVLSLSKTIVLPNVKGGFSHHSADGKRHRLFVCATTNETVEVVDLDAGNVIKSLASTKPAATCFAPDVNLLSVAQGKNIRIFDAKSFAMIASVSLPGSADELRYDSRGQQLFAGCMTGPKTGVVAIDLVLSQVTGQAVLTQPPQGFCLESDGDRLFACTPGSRQVGIVNRKKMAPAGAWTLPDVQGGYPIAYDSATHRLFVGCRKPAELLVLNTDTGETVAKVEIGGDTDDLAFDAVNGRIYAACGEGVISVVQQDDANHYRNIATIETGLDARNGLFIPETAEFCVTVPQRNSAPARILVYKATPPKP